MEHKYKIWNKLSKKMIPLDHLDLDMIIGEIKWKATSVFLTETDRMIWLQFTNNRAKNGDVYHKDILEFKINCKITYGIVEFVDDCWAIVDNEGEYIIGLWECIYNCGGFIKGNAYEHPDLMK